MLSSKTAQPTTLADDPRYTIRDLAEEFVPWEVDFRSVYAEVLRSHLGVADVDAVFPEPGSIAAPLGFV